MENLLNKNNIDGYVNSIVEADNIEDYNLIFTTFYNYFKNTRDEKKLKLGRNIFSKLADINKKYKKLNDPKNTIIYDKRALLIAILYPELLTKTYFYSFSSFKKNINKVHYYLNEHQKKEIEDSFKLLKDNCTGDCETQYKINNSDELINLSAFIKYFFVHCDL